MMQQPTYPGLATTNQFPPSEVVLLAATIFQCAPYLEGAVYSCYIYIYIFSASTEAPGRQNVSYQPVLGTGSSGTSLTSTETLLDM